jgi:hypothetical protein
MCTKTSNIMKTMDLSFLKDVKLEVVKKVAPKAKTSVPKLPTDADLRVFPSGRVYPSVAFAAEYELEFVPKIALVEGEEPTVIVGNGLDIFSSKKWGMIMGKLPEELVFITAVPKSAAKVDLWASTKYDVDNNLPKASVFLQGASTFSKDILVPMLADIYAINWAEVEFVDFKIARDMVIPSENGIYHLPKVVSTGQHKGEDTYIRRENLTICPLVVEHVEVADVKVDPKSNLDKAIGDGNKAGEMFTMGEEIAKDEAKDETTETEAGTVDPGDDWATKLGAK